MKNSLEDEQLILAFIQGDEEAFSKLYQRHYPFVYKYLMKLTMQEQRSEDLAQETMLKAYLKITTFKGDSRFSTWLISIASNIYLDSQRKEGKDKKKLSQLGNMLSRQLNWNANMQGWEWSDHFIEFNQLDPKLKLPILLKHYYGYQYDEIAKLLNIREGTVKTRVHHGLKRLRKEWRVDEDG
ncbi:RNA polymerase sigma factor SigY [Oceanobacillus sp. CFH 90083]|uniref:RNA polymerase sigma factor SigY n=1 Tax=Oceanobacillus sp. CFH 90083 TaxID=2592336 RepID=UPI00128D6CEA|nr:RNA polymerase sigma factor SigY [Oceanobacillus sp. CFH 90083]